MQGLLLCSLLLPSVSGFTGRPTVPRAWARASVAEGKEAAPLEAGPTDEESPLELGRKHFIRTIVEDDLASGKHAALITRFPPEPNGYLHIGHAKSICLNFGLAKEYKGRTHMRFDDTNPVKEDIEYVNSIMEDVRWLTASSRGDAAEAAGGDPWSGPVRHASDYFDVFYDAARYLVDQGLAYVDFLTAEEMREYRGTLTEPGRDSPDRDARTPAENLELLEQMRAGGFEDGKAPVLRAKIDMASPNMNLRDPTLYRVRRATHPILGDKWCIYPMYDFAHALSDALEGITHSLCTLEFADHRPLYDWAIGAVAPSGLLDGFGEGDTASPNKGKAPEEVVRPRQIEFSRLNLQYTVLSKRKLIGLVQDGHVQGWDDPRMPTISGLRRRGIPAEALRLFCERVGISKAENNIDMSVLEDCARLALDEEAPRAFGVLDPVKLTITNWPEGEVETFEVPSHPRFTERGGAAAAAGSEAAGSEAAGFFAPRQLPFSGSVFIDREDFMEEPTSGFNRLVPGGQVRLRYAYVVTCEEVVKDPATGAVVEIKASYDAETRAGAKGSGPKVKGIIQWVSEAHAVDAEVRLYDRLFTAAEPGKAHEDGDHLRDINPDSVTVLKGCKVEPCAAVLALESKDDTAALAPVPALQFERVGYFVHDSRDSAASQVVLNRVVTLRDSWAPAAGKGKGKAAAGKGKGEGKVGAKAADGVAAVAEEVTGGDPRYPYSSLKASAQAKVADELRVELRVGKVLSARAHPDAEALLIEEVDVGDASGPRTVVSGLAKWVKSPADLEGQMVVAVTNLKPAKMRGVESAAMLLAASSISEAGEGEGEGEGEGDPEVVELLAPPEGARVGERVSVEGLEASEGDLPDPLLKSEGQLKAWKRFASALECGPSGEALVGGKKLTTTAGPCVAPTLRNAALG